jgi:ABC-type glycerol-3-phosphate transport system substrate-binding protein
MRRKLLLAATSLALFSTLTGAVPAHHAALATGHAGALTGTLTVFDWQSFSGPKGKAVIAGYEKAHPGVTIKLMPMPPGDPTVWEQSVLTAHAAPDIMVPPYTQAVFSDLGKNYWLDLTSYLNTMPNPYVAGNKHWIDVFQRAANAQQTFEGSKYYVVSWSAQDALFFYNKAIFQKAGIKHTPTTWSELLADATIIKKAGYLPFLHPLGENYPIGINGSILSQFENQVMGATFKKLDRDHNGIVDIKELLYGIKHRIYSPMNADYQEAWNLLKQYSAYWQPNASGDKGDIDHPAAVADQLFFSGKAAMYYSNTGFLAQLATVKVGFPWDVFKFPQIMARDSKFAGNGPKNVGIWGAWNANSFAIPVTTKNNGHLPLALDFLMWVTAPQNDIPAATEAGYLPIASTYKAPDSVHAAFSDVLQHPTMQFAAEATLGPEWLKERISTMQNYLLGMESLSQAMSDMQRYTDQAANTLIKLYHFTF